MASRTLDGLTVLVVDDDPGPLELYREVLTMAGARVRVSTSARAALLMVQQEVPDVVVSDITMPGEDGYWLIRALRELPPDKGGRIPALAVTGDPVRHSSERTRKAGYDAHLAKPVQIAEFSATVARLAGGPMGSAS
ncbi:MAG: response regulator [Candidatus Rokuibacteriota bacterium]|jgi:CheY-like chemotaxis protein|nr:MAG: response regulator [Candidatus Rokubacteria bacterium]